MIFDVLLNVISWLLQNTVGRIPTISILPSGFLTAIETVVEYMYAWDWIVPVSTIVLVMTTLLVMAFAEFTFFIAWFTLDYVARNLRR